MTATQTLIVEMLNARLRGENYLVTYRPGIASVIEAFASAQLLDIVRVYDAYPLVYEIRF